MRRSLALVAALVLLTALPFAAAARNESATVSAGPAVRTAAPEPQGKIALGSGGPDGFGYMWIDSDTVGGPAFDWVGITSFEGGSGTNTGMTGDDQMDTINMNPFGFPFYDGSFDRIYVSSNGFLSFTYSGYAYPTNQPLPFVSITDGIFPLWDDMNLGLGGSVWYWYDSVNVRFIIEFYQVMHFASGGPYTFEVILNADGTILFQYLDVNTPTNSNTIGIQGGDGSSNYFLQYYYDGLPFDNEVHDSLAILFAYQKLEHDVKAVNIVSPGTTIDPGSAIDIEANVLNYGLNPETFDVCAEIESAGVIIYQSFQAVTALDTGQIANIVFPDRWYVPAGDGLSYDVSVFTMLIGDLNPSNDTVSIVTRAISTEKLCIDDGTMENAYAFWDADNAWGVRYTPSEYPAKIESVWVYILSAGDPYYPWPDASHQEIQISVYDEAGGQPGTELSADTVLPDDDPPSWVSAYPRVDINSGDFWVVNVQLTDHPGCEGQGVDVTVNNSSQIWARIGGAWQQYGGSVSGDVMICAFVKLIAPHDVSTVSVDVPGQIVEANAAVNPVGTVKNVGQNTESFEVACMVDSAGVTVWGDTLPVFDLDPGNTEQIFFDVWNVGGHGAQYDVTVRTILASDTRSGNDAKAIHTQAFKIIYEIPSPPTAIQPTIDGIIDFAEWSDSNHEDISDILAKYGMLNLPGSAMLYVKNDDNYVYLAVDAPFDMTRTNWDNIWLAFDDDNDGAFPDPGDDSEGVVGLYYTSLLDLAVYMPVYSDGSTGDMSGVNFAAATAMPLGHQQYEMSIPIGPLPEQLNCNPSDTVGMLVGVTDTTEAASETGGWWVQSIAPANWNNPSVYGKLILSTDVGVEETRSAVRTRPAVNFLSQNSPNPFRSTTSLRFGIAEYSHASIDVFDAAGRRLKNLFAGRAAPGTHVVTWDGTTEAGSLVPSGTYFVRMIRGKDSFTRRMVVLR
jgi:hypothetical protein